MNTEHTDCHTVVVVGGGTAGATVAASLLRRQPSLDVAIIEPADTHYYQPAFTLVGARDYSLDDTARPMGQVLPERANWIRDAVTGFQPEADRVTLANGHVIE